MDLRNVVVLSGLLLAGCAVGPEYRTPDLKMPDHWQVAQSGQLAAIQDWWSQFDDATLLDLQKRAQANSPTLAKATAAIDKARASRLSAGAGLWPDVTANASGTGSGSLRNSTGVTRTASATLDASWELDLFGKTRRNIESADALLAARQADWHDARVSLAAEVASDYVDYRACRIKQHFYEDEANSQDRTTTMTQRGHQAGTKALADLRLAQASAASTRATAISQKTDCEVLVKTLVALIDIDEPTLRSLLGNDPASLPVPSGLAVSSVPADLLRQRPDVVSAERELASTSALIGVAEAERWPALTLSGSVGLSKSRGTAISAPWSFGPALSLPVFDGGTITASIRSARADYDSALAAYRQTVLDAVKEVEQDLARLDSMADQEAAQRASVEGYRDYLAATERSWRAGSTSQLNLETTRRTTISAEISLITLQQDRLSYWIALYKAVGGGWEGTQGVSK